MKFQRIKKIWVFISISLLFQISFGAENTAGAKKEIKSIENKIDVQNNKIKKIDAQKDGIEEQIKKNEEEIASLKSEQEKLNKDMKKIKNELNKNQRQLSESSGELKKMRSSHEASVVAWNRYSLFKTEEDLSEINKFNAQKMIFTNVRVIENAENEVSNIKQEKVEIESKKSELESLNKKINLNKNKLDKKNSEQEKLIKKLNRDKLNYESIVAKLKEKKAQIEREIDNIIKVKAKKTQTPVKYETAKKGVGRLEKPLAGQIVTKYKQPKNGISLNGIEIRGELGSPIKSASKGKVIYSDDFQGLGKVVMIEYGYDLIGVYGNLISTDVKVGDVVGKNEKIGILGYSSDGKPDLYYEVRFNMKSVNPESFF